MYTVNLIGITGVSTLFHGFHFVHPASCPMPTSVGRSQPIYCTGVNVPWTPSEEMTLDSMNYQKTVSTLK